MFFYRDAYRLTLIAYRGDTNVIGGFSECLNKNLKGD